MSQEGFGGPRGATAPLGLRPRDVYRPRRRFIAAHIKILGRVLHERVIIGVWYTLHSQGNNGEVNGGCVSGSFLKFATMSLVDGRDVNRSVFVVGRFVCVEDVVVVCILSRLAMMGMFRIRFDFIDRSQPFYEPTSFLCDVPKKINKFLINVIF